MNKLLVVDDDDSMRNLLRARLAGSYQVIDTGDPEQALALALEHKPDAVLLDLMMPGFSGYELCQSLRSMSYTARIPVFIITGKGGAVYKIHDAFCMEPQHYPDSPNKPSFPSVELKPGQEYHNKIVYKFSVE